MEQAVVIGSGPNGLVAANMLADAGWSVLVLEQQDRAGGAIATDRGVHLAYLHDVFSAFYPLAVASPALKSLALEKHGLRWAHAPAVLGEPFVDGGWALQLRDVEATALLLDEDHAGDGLRWLDLCAQWQAAEPHVLEALLGPFPPVGAATTLARRHLGIALKMMVPLRRILSGFGGRAAAALLRGNAAHADVSSGSPGSAAFALMLTMLGHTHGYPSPVGGAGKLAEALTSRLTSVGGEVRTGERVTGVDTSAGRVVAVRTASGERFAARHVLADVTLPALVDDLLDEVPASLGRARRRFRWDPATIKIDWALSGPMPWREQPIEKPGTIHLGSDGDTPVIAGMMTTTDPRRSPPATEAMWAYVHVPRGPRWSKEAVHGVADAVQQRFEAVAPGFGELLVGRRVIGPHDLESLNPNLSLGAIGGGTQGLRQQLVLRGLHGGAGTGVEGLYLASSAAHPGGGVHGACGANAARAALREALINHAPPIARRIGRSSTPTSLDGRRYTHKM